MTEIIIYDDPEIAVPVQVTLDGETVWLTQAQMAELFSRERSVITKHIRNVFRDGELEQKAVRAIFAHTAADGKIYQTEHYNLDVIISVGYRVKSPRGVRFRQWATSVLKSHLLHGFSLNRQRLAERVCPFPRWGGCLPLSTDQLMLNINRSPSSLPLHLLTPKG